MGAKKQTALKSLSRGRPPMAKSARTMSRKASRTLINNHHQLEKKRKQAIARNDQVAEAAISQELAKLGGLDHYQQASLQGQSIDRGGDTSKILLEWLPLTVLKQLEHPLRMLEVGALSTRNACSTSGVFDMVHIDLNSQEPGIQQQDFMERPIPTKDLEKFDMISLSLVLNFVPDAIGRGEMLRRTLSFLKLENEVAPALSAPLLPCLFVVLPRSCVDNSRYFTDARFEQIMTMLGYIKLRNKKTQKLDYTLWRRESVQSTGNVQCSKKEINPGRTRNNFSVILKHSSNPPS
ncbi:25S rRNA adenine-N(1) methyltransferase [Paramyrothecium foliicola]|nr:25S rRNA adenine-N(1) methyltransferase [Paramyrothecium foliicola]